MSKLVALLDGDVLLYQAGAACEQEVRWDCLTDTIWSDPGEYQHKLDDLIQEWTQDVEADETLICLSDPKINWREFIWPDYKGNRREKRKPCGFKQAREYLETAYHTDWRSSLEADDVMGILATEPELRGIERVVVTVDKDLRQIPGLLYNPMRPEYGIQTISPEEADRFHLFQTLCGDRVDNYPGCPGVGEVTAERILEHGTWAEVVAAYEKAGKGERDALIQAQIARILRWDEYEPEQMASVICWQPGVADAA